MSTPEGPPVAFRAASPEGVKVNAVATVTERALPAKESQRPLEEQPSPEPQRSLDELDEPLYVERSSNVWRWVGIVMIVVMLVAAGIGTYLLYERQQRRKARRRKKPVPSVLLDTKSTTRHRTSLRKFESRKTPPSTTSRPVSPTATSKPTGP